MRRLTVLVALLAAAVGAGYRSGTPDRAPHQPPPRKSLWELPFGARPPVSAALGAADRAYWIRRSAAFNPAQRLRLSFARGSVGVQTADGWVSFGSRGRPSWQNNRVTYRLGPVTEWYLNGPLGLEQGFTVDRSLGAPRDLVLSERVGGSLHPVVDRGRRGLTFEDARGRGVVTYGGLAASDARGRPLAAWLTERGDLLLLGVDVRGARYPIQIDPLIQSAELSASDGADGDQLGDSVAISGGTIAVGAPQHSVAGHAGQGAVYVFSASASGAWQTAHQTAELTASDGAAGDGLGSSVGISGTAIVAGAPDHGHGGAGYVFARPPSGHWGNATQTAELTGSDTASGDEFGQSVGISGSTIVAGAPEHAVGSNGGQGSVYVFTASAGGQWSQAAELTASDGGTADELGYAVAVSGATIAATAPDHGFLGHVDQGAVYAYTEPAGGWRSGTQNAELIASDGAAGDGLGDSVATSGSTIAAGASFHAVGANAGQGAVYVFSEPFAAGWRNAVQSAELVASDGAPGDGLGASLAIDGTTVLAGAPEHTVSGGPARGAIYTFVQPPAGWRNGAQSEELSGSDGAAGDEFGYSVGAAVPTVVVGAPGHAAVRGAATGSAYVFVGPLPAPPPAPVIRAFKQSHQVWREGSRFAVITRAYSPSIPVGTTFSFTINERALAVLTFSQRLSGRRVGGKCVVSTAHNRSHRPCTRTVRRGAITFATHPGINRVAFEGLISRGHELPVGQYSVAVVAAAAGGSSRPDTLHFKIAPS